MLARDFCYWLQGYFEITNSSSGKLPLEGMTAEEVSVVSNHLNLVFVHDIRTPVRSNPPESSHLM